MDSNVFKSQINGKVYNKHKLHPYQKAIRMLTYGTHTIHICQINE